MDDFSHILKVVSRTKTPAEIMAEYERFQREQEERRLQQRTNPKVEGIETHANLGANYITV